MGFEIRSKNWFRRQGLPSSQECAWPQPSGRWPTEESQAQPNTPMNPSDLLAETVFGKRASSKKHHPAGPHFGVQNLAPKVGALIRRNGFAAPVLGSEIWTPKRGPTNVVFPTFLGVSACAFNALRRGQACWSKRSRVTFFDDAPSEATCAPPSQRAQFARVCLAAAIRAMADRRITGTAKHADEPV